MPARTCGTARPTNGTRVVTAAPDWPVAGSIAHSEKVEYCGLPASSMVTPSAARCCANTGAAAMTNVTINALVISSLNASTPQRLNASTPQRLKPSSPQALKPSSPQALIHPQAARDRRRTRRFKPVDALADQIELQAVSPRCIG